MGSDLRVCMCVSVYARLEKRAKKICEIMLPGLNNRVICHFSPFKYDDTIIMSILSCRSSSEHCALIRREAEKEEEGDEEAEIMM